MTIEALQKRIKTTEDLRSVVSTMKSLSSVSILQYEQANVTLKKYRENLIDAFHAMVLSQGLPELSKDKSAPRYLFILIGSDSGLVGRFNKEVIEQTSDWLKSNNINISNVWFITIGKRIAALAEQKHLKIFAKYVSSIVFELEYCFATTQNLVLAILNVENVMLPVALYELAPHILKIY